MSTLMTEVGSTNGDGYVGSTELMAQAVCARCLARAIVVSFEACDEAEVPLSELQKIAIVEAALMEFDGLGAHLNTLSTIRSFLRDLGSL